MNYKLIFNLFSKLMLVISALMALVGVGAMIEAMVGDRTEIYAEWALLLSALAGGVLGGVTILITRKPRDVFGRREAMLLVALSWLVGAGLAALPFYLWAYMDVKLAEVGHPFRNPINCYFESMSGLSTTGATILTDIKTVPQSLLLWRATTHWLGGLGIVVLFVAVLPMLGAGGKKMFRVEAPGPSPEGVRPHIRQTARILWLIYCGLTVAEIIALKFCGMSWYESVCHTFATLATGGFSTENASMSHFNAAAQYVVVAFMFLAGVNFSLYFCMLRGRLRDVWKDTEFRVYCSIIFGASLFVIAMIYGSPIDLTTGQTVDGTLSNSIQYGLFTTISIQTTTGFCTADFNQWPFAVKALLLCLMFVGGSAGSTGGGIKVIRVWMAIKILWTELEKAFRPNVVRSIKIGKTNIDQEMRLGTISYVLGIVLLCGMGAGLLMIFEQNSDMDFTTAATASVATIFNIGPGLHQVGAIENYSWFTNGSKILMSGLMVVGRLEVFAILVLFTPRFWRGD